MTELGGMGTPKAVRLVSKEKFANDRRGGDMEDAGGPKNERVPGSRLEKAHYYHELCIIGVLYLGDASSDQHRQVGQLNRDQRPQPYAWRWKTTVGT